MHSESDMRSTPSQRGLSPCSPNGGSRVRGNPRPSMREHVYLGHADVAAGASVQASPRGSRRPAAVHVSAEHAAVQRSTNDEDHYDVADSAPGLRHPDTSGWNWQPCENRPELLTYHDGRKRWFHCSKCEYWNDRLYHTKMHYERIHVKQGRSMPRKRKYMDPSEPQDFLTMRSPDKKPAVESGLTATPHRQGEHLIIETPPKGKGTPSNNKSTPAASKNPHYASGSPKSRGGKGGAANASSKSSPGSGARKANGTPSQHGKSGGSVLAAARGTGSSCAKNKDFDEAWQNSHVFTFGSVFFQDDGAGLSFDVANLDKAVATGRASGAASNQGRSLQVSHASTPKVLKVQGRLTSGAGARGKKKKKVIDAAAVLNASPQRAGIHTANGSPSVIGGSPNRVRESCDAMLVRSPSVGIATQRPLGVRNGHNGPVHELAGNAGAASSSGLSSSVISPNASPQRFNVYAPVTPVRSGAGKGFGDRCSPSLADGPLGDGLYLGALSHGSVLSSTSSTSERRRRANPFGTTSSLCNTPLVSVPGSGKMIVPVSPPMGDLQGMSGMGMGLAGLGGCLADESPMRRSSYHLRSVPVTPNTDRLSSRDGGHVQGTPRVRGGREGSSDIFSTGSARTPTYPMNLYCFDSDSLLCNEYLPPPF